MRAFAPVAVLLCFSCVIVMNEETSSRDTGLPDAGTDGGHGGGGGGSGGDLDGSIYWGDGGHDPPHGFPGSGQEGDPGTAVHAAGPSVIARRRRSESPLRLRRWAL